MTVANIFRHSEKQRNGILQLVAYRTPDGMPIREMDIYHLKKKGWEMTGPAAGAYFEKIKAARGGDQSAKIDLQSVEKNLVDRRLVEEIMKDGPDQALNGALRLACHLLAVEPISPNNRLAELHRILTRLRLGAGEADFAYRVLEAVDNKLRIAEKGLAAVFEGTPLAPYVDVAYEILGEEPPESNEPPGVLLPFKPRKKE